jgi:hypothetical protein
MRTSEAEWIAAQLARLPPADISPLVNLGSSTAEFRERKQPHIDRLIFKPLAAAGVRAIHSDLKEAPGVEIAGDMLDPTVRARLRAAKPKAVLSSNLLEHVHGPERFAAAMTDLVPVGGYLFITAPRSYPYHADPIDTGFRPTPAELAALFPNCTMVWGDVVEDVSFGHELRAKGPLAIVRAALGVLDPRREIGRARRDRVRWLFRPFSATCVVMQRT